MDLLAIQQGLATAASAISGLRAFATLPGTVNPPTFAVIENDLEYNQTFGNGMTQINFVCGLYLPSDEQGREALVSYLTNNGPTSIKAALETDKTLGGTAKTLNVDRVRGAFRLYTIGPNDYLGANFDVRVWG